jgi:DNA-binding MarR family transcriptional regulator
LQDIHLTAKGRRVRQRVDATGRRGQRATLRALDDHERAVLHDLLLRVAEAHG